MWHAYEYLVSLPGLCEHLTLHQLLQVTATVTLLLAVYLIASGRKLA